MVHNKNNVKKYFKDHFLNVKDTNSRYKERVSRQKSI